MANNKKNIRFTLIGLVAVAALFFGGKKIWHFMNNEDTDNAQLETDIVPVIPKVGGWVTRVLVNDNQLVKAGDTLVLIDNRDLQIKVEQALAALTNAEANVVLLEANARVSNANVGASSAAVSVQNANIQTAQSQVGTAQANLEAAKIRAWKAGQDFTRYNQLFTQKSATQQQLDQAKAEKESADAGVAAAEKQVATTRAQLETARKQVDVGDNQKTAAISQAAAAQKQIDVARAQVTQRKAELELTQLQFSYAVVTAPISGAVSKKNVQPGQLVNAGAPIMSLVNDQDLWITANFKETQIGDMKVGDKVKFTVDAYPGKAFEGQIQSFAGATGAKFSLLPPDNSTGNFVKVVQRIPTKITVTRDPSGETPLRAGMSVHVTVPVR